MEVFILNKFNRSKKSNLFSKKSYYGVLVICIVMVGVACFCSYRQTSARLSKELSSVSELNSRPAVTPSPYENEAAAAAKNKEGVKKPTDKPKVTEPKVTEEKTDVHSKEKDTASVEVKKFAIPLSGSIIQDFSGNELVKNQTTGAWQTHNGVDISGAAGDEVRTMTDGTVSDVLDDPLWGVVVVIDHGNGITGRYCGLNKGLTVEKGSKVSAQDVIGAVGNTADIESGMETHLHFEVIKNGDYVNPVDVINNKG